MPFLNIVPRNTYHKNGTQWIGKICAKLIGEMRYERIRLEKRIAYAKWWYTKQSFLLKFNQQYPWMSLWFSVLNKHDTSVGLPARRQYERHQDFAVYSLNSEGWFQVYFLVACAIVIAWNYNVCAVNYDIRGVSPEDDDLYRYKDGWMTMNFDRTKYNYAAYFFSPHFYASVRYMNASKDHADDPRNNLKPQMRGKYYYAADRYVKYYGYSQNMRLV